MDALALEFSSAGTGWGVTFALVGPPGCGKTACVRSALAQAERSGAKVAYIDLRQAREIWQADDFYDWLTRAVANGLANGAERPVRRAKKSAMPRVLWSDTLERLIAKRANRVLLALDHIESIADNCAHELISDLREIQDKSGGTPAWNRFRCLVAGTVSVYQLRRRAASPNLQFEVRCLPAFDASTAEADTRSHFELSKHDVSDEALRAAAQATSGEPTFLTLIAHYLPPGRIEPELVDAALDLAARDAMRHVELSSPATLYLLDDQFRARADDLLERRPATWCDATVDIDPYQLAGGLVLGDPTRREARFRNALIQHTLEMLRAERSDISHTPSEAGTVVVLSRRCTAADSLAELLEGLAAAWQHLIRLSGTPSLLLKDPLENREFLIEQSAICVEQKRLSLKPVLEVSASRSQVRVIRSDRQWWIDAVEVNHLCAGVRMVCGDEFVPTVSMRESLRLWGLFLRQVTSNLQSIGLQALGRAALKGKLPHGGKRVFVSSTYLDLREHRRAVMEQIVRRDFLFRGMEHFGASPDQPSARIVEEVRDADIYVGIFGVRYGSLEKHSGLSMTQIEFDEAEARSIPMLLYVMKPNAEIAYGSIESDPKSTRKLQALIARVKEKLVYEFSDPTDLSRQVYLDLGKFV